MSLTEGARLGPYEIIGKIGEGGMGEVYRARDPRLGRNVAIKILPAAFSTDTDRLWRFEREAKAVASLNHPNICTIHDIGDHDGHRYLVMELLEGMTLSSTLETGPLPAARLIELAIQIADALDAAHGAGIIHRDLKPANIFVTKRGEAKLLDFGLAKLTEDGGVANAGQTALGTGLDEAATMAGRRGETTVGTLLGTAAYMSPEQARGEPADAQSDLFSFGVVLYEMATGRAAFSGKTMAVLFDGILNKDPKPIAELNPQIPAELVHVVTKALEKEKDLRYRTASDIRADLKRLRRDSAPRRIVGDDEPFDSAQSRPATTAAVPRPPSTAPPVMPSIPVAPPPAPVELDRKARRRQNPRRRTLRLAVVLLLIFIVGRSAWRRRSGDDSPPPSFASLEVKQLTSTGNAFRPAVSADGKYVVYLQLDADGPGIWLRQVAATSAVNIMRSEPNAYPQAGTIGPDSTFVDVLRSDGGIWRVPFLGGTPKRIVDHANTPIGWAPDGRQMTYTRPASTGAGQDLVVANADGGDQRAVATHVVFATGMPGGTNMAPAWSPDGRRIAMFERLGEDIREIGVRVFEVSSGQSEVVHTRGDVPLGLGWYDDKTLLVAQALETGTPSQLWRIAVPGGERTRLSNDVTRYSELSLSDDRNTLVTSRPETRVEIWVGDSTGNGREVVKAAPFLSSAYTYATLDWNDPQLLLTHTFNGRYEIFRFDPTSSNPPAPIVAGREFSTAADGTIVFRAVGDADGLWKVGRDGQGPIELAKGSVSYPFISADGTRVVFNSRAGGPQTLWQVPAAGGEATQLLTVPVGINSFSDVAPNNRSIVFVVDGKWTLCDLPACTDRKTVGPARGAKPRWMRDGRAFTYLDSFNPSGNLWVQPLDGSAPRQLTHFTDGKFIGHYAWSRDGRQLAISRAQQASDIVLFTGLKGQRSSETSSR